MLIVGASATGVQLADEINRSGRHVTLSVGEHVRLPRTYRGRDVLWWMDASGIWNQRYDEVDDLTRARRLPSPQLIGTPERTTLDLNVLRAAGVEVVGRLAAVRDGRALFSGGLRNQFALADLKMTRLLDTFDDWAHSHARDSEIGPPERFEPTHAPASSRLDLDLRSGEIRSIIWATGFRPDYSWLDVPVVDHKGHLRHDGGVVDAPGLYAIGLPLLRRRKSTFIHGAEDDARDIVEHLAGYSPTERTAGRSKPVDEIRRVDRTCTEIQVASCSFRSLASPVGRKLRAGIVNQRASLRVHDGRRAEVPGLAQTRDEESAQILGVGIGRELRQIRHKIHALSGHRTSEVRPDAGNFQPDKIDGLSLGAAPEIFESRQDVLHAIGVVRLIVGGERSGVVSRGATALPVWNASMLITMPPRLRRVLTSAELDDRRDPIRMNDQASAPSPD